MDSIFYQYISAWVTKLTPSDVVGIGIILATLVLAIATSKGAEATFKIVEAQFVPCVILYIQRCKSAPSILELVVKNIGTAPALNISFGLPDYFPTDAEGSSIDEALLPKNLEGGPLINGMKYLAPGETWSTVWGQYGGLMKGLEGKPIIANITYTYPDEKRTGTSKANLDVRDFETSSWIKTLEEKQANSIELLATTVKELKGIIAKKCPSENTKELYPLVYVATEVLNSPDKVETRTNWASRLALSEMQQEEGERWAKDIITSKRVPY